MDDGALAATERRDRHSTEALLAKMERDGEVKHVSRGQWADPEIETHPTKSVVIVGKAGGEGGNGGQVLGISEEISVAESKRQSQRKHNASKTVVFPVVIPASANPLADKGNLPESQHHHDHNGLDRSALNGSSVQAKTRVWIREVWPPALGPKGDDVFDIEPGWRP